MTTRPVRGVEIAEVDEAAVASYLSATPEFFDRHAQLLARIRLPDTRGGATTVSLVERQVEVLRERNRQLERKVKDFVDVARENDALGSRVLAMARRLIAVRNDGSADRRDRGRAREEFDAGQSVPRAPRGSHAPKASWKGSPFLRSCPADAPELRLPSRRFSARQAALRAVARFPA